jgi:hypothetical protein
MSDPLWRPKSRGCSDSARRMSSLLSLASVFFIPLTPALDTPSFGRSAAPHALSLSAGAFGERALPNSTGHTGVFSLCFPLPYSVHLSHVCPRITNLSSVHLATRPFRPRPRVLLIQCVTISLYGSLSVLCLLRSLLSRRRWYWQKIKAGSESVTFHRKKCACLGFASNVCSSFPAPLYVLQEPRLLRDLAYYKISAKSNVPSGTTRQLGMSTDSASSSGYLTIQLREGMASPSSQSSTYL